VTQAQDLNIDLSFPPSHTIGAYISQSSSNLGFVRKFIMDICWTIRGHHARDKFDVIAMNLKVSGRRRLIFA
jgi:hypothetical protein